MFPLVVVPQRLKKTRPAQAAPCRQAGCQLQARNAVQQTATMAPVQQASLQSWPCQACPQIPVHCSFLSHIQLGNAVSSAQQAQPQSFGRPPAHQLQAALAVGLALNSWQHEGLVQETPTAGVTLSGLSSAACSSALLRRSSTAKAMSPVPPATSRCCMPAKGCSLDTNLQGAQLGCQQAVWLYCVEGADPLCADPAQSNVPHTSGWAGTRRHNIGTKQPCLAFQSLCIPKLIRSFMMS